MLVSRKSSSHHASNPIITFGLRVNSREPDYQDAKNHHYSGDEMVISHRHPNGPLPGFVWRRPAAVFLFPVALLLRSAVDRVAASAAPAWMADIYLCVYFFTVCAFDRSLLRLLFAQLDVHADAAVEADSNLFTSPESFPSL